jgi:hypothetical protein
MEKAFHERSDGKALTWCRVDQKPATKQRLQIRINLFTDVLKVALSEQGAERCQLSFAIRNHIVPTRNDAPVTARAEDDVARLQSERAQGGALAFQG